MRISKKKEIEPLLAPPVAVLFSRGEALLWCRSGFSLVVVSGEFFPARGASNCLVVVSGGGLVSVLVHGVDPVAKSGGSGLAVSSRVGGSPVGLLALVSCGFWASLRLSSIGRLLVKLRRICRSSPSRRCLAPCLSESGLCVSRGLTEVSSCGSTNKIEVVAAAEVGGGMCVWLLGMGPSPVEPVVGGVEQIGRSVAGLARRWKGTGVGIRKLLILVSGRSLCRKVLGLAFAGVAVHAAASGRQQIRSFPDGDVLLLGTSAEAPATRLRVPATAQFTCGAQRPRPPVPGGP
ncbi:hypothetical protein ISN45_Aa01g007000 [Arabidopsis thaliana x Arabidopsis arenosa]|uniref:Uncharacterized protein n=1 Tax=Arabidopsis thaliana x Arabidopsis arenosa TaxID=1240361 RepID=A0A8T2C165_9BRAS|nr:hypothetical protein ISN45_Aa01g007000 [Arabidopsis thaliana x Arabidopsis arenosa]